MIQFKIKTAETQRWQHVSIDGMPMSCGCEGSLNDCLEHAYREQIGDFHPDTNVEIVAHREVKPSREVGIARLTVYRRWQYYGGPEEGGWYYTAYEPVREFVVPKASAPRLRRLLDRYVALQNEGMRQWEDGRYDVATHPLPRNERRHYC